VNQKNVPFLKGRHRQARCTKLDLDYILYLFLHPGILIQDMTCTTYEALSYYEAIEIICNVIDTATQNDPGKSIEGPET
jgi:hypothetical protein